MNRSARLETARLTLRLLEERDKQRMVRILQNNEIKQTYMLPDFASDEEAAKYFYRLVKVSQGNARLLYGICLDGEVIGFLNDCGQENGTIELGYVIDPAQRGKGYAPEALGVVIAELLRTGWQQVIAGYFVENQPSKRVMEKCGMHKLDMAAEIEYRGQKHRCEYYGITRC